MRLRNSAGNSHYRAMDKTTTDRSKFHIAVHVFVIKDNQVLLGCRQNTGWFDNTYDSVGGHFEIGEHLQQAAARELYEEANLKVSDDALKLFHITHYIGEKPYIYFMFLTKKWQGTLKNNEPKFMRELAFYPINKLPANITPYAKIALESINSDKLTYSYFEGKDTSS